MATRELPELTKDRDGDDVDDEEVWVTHYSSNHQILLVGEGDFSFSSSLATRFGSASHICASSLDSYVYSFDLDFLSHMVIEADAVVKKYGKARSNLEALKKLGASLLHGVDATKLQFHPDLHFRRFDRIIFNFPHAGFHSSKESDSHLIQKHRALLFGFFHGASRMLRADGEIHVSHKNKAPFCHWKLEELASKCSLVLKQCVAFEKSEYPGYENKRGDGSRCDQPFILGDCSTFKFRFSRVAKEFYAEKVKYRESKEQESKCPQVFPNKHPLSLDLLYPLHTQLEGVSQRPLSLDLLVQSRHRAPPLDLSYYHEHRRSQFEDALRRPVSFGLERDHFRFQDYSIQRDRLMFTERSSFQFQDFPFQAGHHHKEQFLECSSRFHGVSHGIYNGEQQRMLPWTNFPHQYSGESVERHRLLGQDFPVQATQEPFFQGANHFNGVSHETYNWEHERMLRRTTFPQWYPGQSPERRPLLCQNFPVQASQEPFFNRPNRFNGDPHGIYYGEEGRMLGCTSFHHPYNGESLERSLNGQSNFNIYPPHHW
ncbi:unnamed protein product [Microthlaspi erraticum]|uniref:25S rRNA (uridine-N(3))-methyltransferase BMT5-like domain-containing protein n=1 Tax=Microthlaspi erraticum TaxID=1685480 RepID=A0A6D2HJD6_9BRAS|nr:unnamed protein product [Microthlaspi erraticum]